VQEVVETIKKISTITQCPKKKQFGSLAVISYAYGIAHKTSHQTTYLSLSDKEEAAYFLND